jgi:carbonic anhydrase
MSKILGGASRIIQGVADFQRRIFGTKKELFRDLKKGQSPLALFITCSDSRIDPNLLTGTQPGELFILRNAGNLVPPQSAGPRGESATVEYALHYLKIREIIVCGHSHCGAMSGLLNPASLEKLPTVRQWLAYAEAILPAVRQAGAGLSPEAMLELTIERNVLLQTEHLKTLPVVAEALTAGNLRLHPWVYHFETGQVTVHDPATDRFVPLVEAPRRQWRAEAVPDAPAGPSAEDVLGDSI